MADEPDASATPQTAESETVSVIVCAHTLDRWDDLRRAADSLRRQTLPPREIFVVIDANPELEQLAREQLDGIQVVANAHGRGLSGGRETGADHATGTILAFLDDDAIADPDWLEQLVVGYGDPNVLGVGGQVDPLWESAPPSWFPPEFNWVIGCTYAGMPVEATRIRNPIGANMSVRADVLERTGPFDVRFARVNAGKRFAGTADDTEFAIRAVAAHPGGYWLYRPQARVLHAVPARRATWSYFVERCRVEGNAKAVLASVSGTRQGLRSERSYVRSVLPRAIARELLAASRGRLAGLGRAGAIVSGLAVTSVTYATARLAAAARRDAP